MTFADWVPAISTTTLLGIALWLLRSVISTRLTKSVQHEFDVELESLRTSLRKSEESVKADLRAKETQIAVLRSGAMSALASRQAALDKRRIEAVDQLWSAVVALAPAKVASKWLTTINFDVATERAAEDPKVRQFFELLGRGFDLERMGVGDASKVRPYMSDLTWALYSAYLAIVGFTVMQFHLLKKGINMPEIMNPKAVSNLIEAALPDQAEQVQKLGPGVFDPRLYDHWVEILEGRLLNELRNILQGVESDKMTVEQTAKILLESDRLMESISKTMQS